MDQPSVLFSDSNINFQDTGILQTTIGFVNPLAIDIYVEKSFYVSNSTIAITGGYIKSFNKSHGINDIFVCYKIVRTDTTPLFSTDGKVTFDLDTRGFFSGTALQNLLKGMPLLSLLIFSLLSKLFPPAIATVLSYISLIGFMFTLGVFIYKAGKTFLSFLKAKGTRLGGILVHYEKDTDILSLTSHHAQIFAQLQAYDISSVVLYQGAVYLKQPLQKKSGFKKFIMGFLFPASADISALYSKIQTTTTTIFGIINSLFTPPTPNGR